jgi:hypothetical protein
MVNLLRAKGVTAAEIDEFIGIMNQEENPISQGTKEVFLSLCEKGQEFLVVDGGADPVPDSDPNDFGANIYGDYATNNAVVEHNCTEFVGSDADKLKAILIG